MSNVVRVFAPSFVDGDGCDGTDHLPDWPRQGEINADRGRGGTWKNVHGASGNRVWRAEQDPRARAVLLRRVSLKKARAKFGR